MRAFLRPAVLCSLVTAIGALGALPTPALAATHAARNGASIGALRHEVATLRRQNAALKTQKAALQTEIATLKSEVTFETVQNGTLASTNATLTTNNTVLTATNSALSSEISTAQATIGGTGDLPTQLATLQTALAGSTSSTVVAEVAALDGLVGIRSIPMNAGLFSAAFQHASIGGDLASQLQVFLSGFDSANFATPTQTHLTFTVGASVPSSLGALLATGPTTS